MLEPDVITNIRPIFIHNGEPVAVDEGARLLGWGIDTIEEAIKWNVIELDTTSHDRPRIRRAPPAHGVRVVTLTAFEVSDRDLVPMLRIRGGWLARFRDDCQRSCRR